MRRPVRNSLILIIVAVAAALVLSVVFPFWRPMVWRSQSIAALKAANNEPALREAVGRYGVFVPRRDGSWFAIRYTDSHSGGIRSLAIARDSGGEWFESKHHFCGELCFFDDWIRAQFLPPDSLEAQDAALYTFDYGHGDLRDIFKARNLEEARAALLRAGFVAMD